MTAPAPAETADAMAGGMDMTSGMDTTGGMETAGGMDPASGDTPMMNDGGTPIDPDAMMAVDGPTTSAPEEMTEEMVAANDAEITKVRELVRKANWDQMAAAAERLTELQLTEEQRADAEALYDLAYMASFYRGGIQRGLGTLKATQDFEVAEGFRVLVVEVSQTSLTVRFSARNKTYSLDEMPMRLSEKIASFALSPEDPDSIAGRAAYHAVSPLSNDEHREQSIEDLQRINGQVSQVNAAAMADQIKNLFSL